jgi:hypothetical protein
MGEPEYVDPMPERVAAVMHERGLTSEDDFLRVKDKLLAEHGDDAFAFASALLALDWRDVQQQL